MINSMYCQIIIYVVILLLIYVTKPKIIYDENKQKFKDFGSNNDQTLFSLPVISISLALFIYLIFNQFSNSTNNIQSIQNMHPFFIYHPYHPM